MNDHNSLSIVGRLTRDSELKYLNGGMALTKFSIAVNRSKKDGDGYKDIASFFDCVLWGKLGESLNQYLVKGKQVALGGSLEQERWEQEGQARSKVVINVRDVQMVGGRKEGEEKPISKPSQPDDISDGDFPDDIPF